jgi:membrane protease YdiL (CAAX protease family)
MHHNDRAVRDLVDEPTLPFHPVLFYALTLAIAWTAWAPLLLHVRGIVELPIPYPVALFVCQTIGAFSPLISMIAIQRIKRTPRLVERVLRKIRLKGTSPWWLLLPAVLPVALAVATAVVHALIYEEQNITILRPGPVGELGWALLLVIPFTFVVAMIGSPLGEEPGWRGYIFDHFALESRGYRGSALVAVMWWVWHVPLFIVLGVAPTGYSFLEMLGHSLLIDSFFLLSGRNLLSAMFYHQGVNISFMFFAAKTQSVAGVTLLLCIAVGLRIAADRRLKYALAEPSR